MPVTYADFEAQLKKCVEAPPEKVAAEVASSISMLGAMSKENIEACNKSVKEANDLMQEMKQKGDITSASLEKLTGFQTEALGRLEKITEGQTKEQGRLNALEALSNRLAAGGGSSEGGSDKKELILAHARRDIEIGLGKSFNPTRDLKEVDVELYMKRKAAFQDMMLRGSGYLPSEAKSLLYEVSANPGLGYVVNAEMDSAFIHALHDTTPIMGLATTKTVPAAADAYEVMDWLERYQGRWVGDTQAPERSNLPVGGKNRIDVNTWEVMPAATASQLRSYPDLESFIIQEVTAEVGRDMGRQSLLGDGVKKPRGILTYPDGSGARGTVRRIKTGSTDGMTGKGAWRIAYSLKSGYTANAKWLMHRTAIGELFGMTDDEGHFVFNQYMGPGAPQPPMLCGYPVVPCEDMPVAETGALAYVFGDIARAYYVVVKDGMIVIRDPYSRKPDVEFLIQRELGGDLVLFEALVIGNCAV